MKQFHPLSFLTGVASGALVLFLISAGYHAVHPTRAAFGGGNRNFQMNSANLSRMAERLGMTEADLQKEIDSGKTMQQIAQEHGVTFGGGRNRANGGTTGSGTTKPIQTGSGNTSSQQ